MRLSIKRNLLVATVVAISASCVDEVRSGRNIYGEEPSQMVVLIDSDSMQESVSQPERLEIYTTATELKNLHDGTLLGATLLGKYFNVEVVQKTDRDKAYLLLSEFYKRDSKGATHWALVDSLMIDMPEGTSIGWTGNVMYGGKIDSELLVLLPEEEEWLYIDIYENILKAWRFDKESRKIYPVSTDSLTCINESYSVY